MARFARDEAAALRPLNDRPPFRQGRELTRRVQNDACVDVDTNHYSVPWRLIGASVSIVASGAKVRIHHAGVEVACHDKRLGRRERAVVLWLAHMRWWTFAVALAGAAVFSVLGWLGLSLPALVRILRRLVAGRTRPAVPFRRKRRFA